MSPLLTEPALRLGDALVAAERLGGGLLAAAALLLLPGLFAALAIARRDPAPRAADALAAAPGLGVLVVALLWWSVDLAGLPIGRPLWVAVVALSSVGIVALCVRRRPRAGGDLFWLLVIWGLALVARLAVIRDLAFPAWVDGVHHTYLTRLLLDQGRIPDDYRPLLAFGPFDYHFGFHALAAAVASLSGAATPDAVLVAGQFLSASAVPAAFLLARLYGASPTGALAAAATAGLVSMMPAYYVSWSRFTQLAGLIAAPAWLMLARRTTRGPAWAAIAGLASAAMLFVHPRVSVMLALLVFADCLVAPERWPGRRRWLPIAPLVALLVAAPWLGRLLGGLIPRLAVAAEGIDAANALDVAPLTTYYDPWIYGLAAAALVAGLTGGNLGAWIALVWLALAFVAANPGLLGLPGTYMLSNGAAIISLWLPAAALVGYGVGALVDGLRARGGDRARWLDRLAAPGIVLVALALGQAPFAALNQGTVLATPRDRIALAEIAQLLPADALVAVNVREWQLRTYMGTDAGYWIGVVTPGRAIVPPLLHGLGPPAEARAISERLAAWEAAAGDPAALARQMRAMGAQWLFVGERGGPIDAARLTATDGFETVLADDGIRLFRLHP